MCQTEFDTGSTNGSACSLDFRRLLQIRGSLETLKEVPVNRLFTLYAVKQTNAEETVGSPVTGTTVDVAAWCRQACACYMSPQS
jgi:hypothetical protein